MSGLVFPMMGIFGAIGLVYWLFVWRDPRLFWVCLVCLAVGAIWAEIEKAKEKVKE